MLLGGGQKVVVNGDYVLHVGSGRRVRQPGWRPAHTVSVPFSFFYGFHTPFFPVPRLAQSVLTEAAL